MDDDWDPRVQGEPGLGPGPYHVGLFLSLVLAGFLAIVAIVVFVAGR